MLFLLVIWCVWVRLGTFQRSVYTTASGLLRRASNYGGLSLYILLDQTVCTHTHTPSVPFLFCRIPPWIQLTRAQLEEVGCDAVFSGGQRVVQPLMLELCVWEMCDSPAERSHWLLGRTPPAAQPVPSPPKWVFGRLGSVSMATTSALGGTSCKYTYFSPPPP